MEQGTPGEDPNNFQWKNKLEDVVSLSEETIADKNAAWERLYGRLRQKPRRISTLWYWAAACVLLVIIIPLITADKKQDISVQNSPQYMQHKNATVPEILSSKENKTADVSSSLIEKKKIAKQIAQENNIQLQVKKLVRRREKLPAYLPPPEYIQKEPGFTSVIVDSPRLITLEVAPVKKKLKVVHINELGDPVIERTNTAGYYERHFLQLKFIKPEDVTSSSLPVNNTGFNIFKSKNVSSK